MVLCIYHNADNDGKGSAGIVGNAFGSGNVEFCGFDHGMPVPEERIAAHEKIVVCDIALPVARMFELSRQKDFIWIDHHISVIEEYEEMLATDPSLGEIAGLRRVGTAAIELTWNYFYPDKPVPEGIRLLALNDLFLLGEDERVRPFEYAVQSLGLNKPGDPIWRELIGGKVDIAAMVEKGRAILSWIRLRNYRLVRTMAFSSELDGLKCLCANMPFGYSEFFDEAPDLGKYDVLINFYRSAQGKWKATFYANKPGVDVSKIAARFGGGGHKGAAGAQFDELPGFLRG